MISSPRRKTFSRQRKRPSPPHRQRRTPHRRDLPRPKLRLVRDLLESMKTPAGRIYGAMLLRQLDPVAGDDDVTQDLVLLQGASRQLLVILAVVDEEDRLRGHERSPLVDVFQYYCTMSKRLRPLSRNA